MCKIVIFESPNYYEFESRWAVIKFTFPFKQIINGESILIMIYLYPQ